MRTGSAFLAVATVLASGASVCLGDTHFVSKTGSNEFPYASPATAASRIQDAVDAAESGDTVRVAEGEYSEPISLKEGLNLLGEDVLKTRLMLRAGEDDSSTLIVAENGCSIRKFTIAFEPEAEGCGIHFKCPSGTVGECIFTGSGSYYTTAIRCESFRGRIVNCLITGFGSGVSCEDSEASILNCTVCSNDRGLSFFWSRTFPTIANTILWYNDEQLYGHRDYEEGLTMRHCNVQQGGIYGSSNIREEPRFVSVEEGLFRLCEDSPCIDAGHSYFPNLPVTDLDGRERIQGAAVDIGAYEFSHGALSIMTDSLPPAAVGVEYVQRLRATGGLLPYRWKGEGLPERLSVDRRGGIVGTPASTGSFSVTLDVWDKRSQSASVQLELEVRNPIYVSASAPDGGDGSSWQKAFNTVQEAVEAASPGDTIRVGPGEYVEKIEIPDEVNLIGEGPGQTIVIAKTSNPYYETVQAPRSGRIEGIAVKGGWYGIRCHGGSPVIRRCSVTGTSYQGIACYSDCFAVIENCVTYFNSGNGIHFCGSSHGEAINSTSYGNTWDGFSFDRSSPRLTNCVAWENGFNLWTYSGWGESSPTITYSNIEEGAEGEGNIAEDPLFLAGENGILALSAGSPCVDAGKKPAACSSMDVAGDERIVGARIDMGAHEFGKLRPFPPSNRRAVQGLLYEVDLHATGGDPPYRWEGIHPSAATVFSTGHLSWRPQEYGRVRVCARVSDSHGTTDSAEFEVQVARPVYVDGSASESGDGSSPQRPVRSIGEALYYIAVPGDAVLVAAGTYRECVRLKEGVDLISLSGPDSTCIVCPESGRDTSAVRFGEPSSVSSFTDGGASNAAEGIPAPRLEGFRIVGGYTGVELCERSADICNCVITGDRVGVRCTDSGGIIDGCTISGADFGIACTRGRPRVSRSIMTGCRIGVYVDPGRPFLRNCVIAGNVETGVEYAEASCPVAIDCILWDNGSDLEECGGSVQVRRSVVKDRFFTERNGNVFVDPLFAGRGNFRRELWVDPASLYEEESGTIERPYKSVEAAPNSLPPYDYHLAAASPCLQANGSFRDMGAYPGETPAASPDSSDITIHLAPGTYDEGPLVLLGHLTLQGAGMNRTVLKPAEGQYSYGGVLIACNGSAVSDLCVSDSSNGITLGGSDVIVSDCLVHSCSNYGFQVKSHDPLILRCKAMGNGSGGFYVSGGSPTIRNCIVADNQRGMAFDQSSAQVLNCTIVGNERAVQCFNYDHQAPSFRNCTIWGNGSENAIARDKETAPTLTYCDVQNGWPGRGNLDSDPLFLPDTSFALSQYSPCIDAGDPDSDYSQEPQPNGGRVNVGAYGNTIYAATSYEVDQDVDGIRDGWEWGYFRSLDFDPDGDTDADGLSEYEEYRSGSSPLLSDSDADGHLDASEVANGTDPADPADPFRIIALRMEERALQIVYPVVPGYDYSVWEAASLEGPWEPIDISEHYCSTPETTHTYGREPGVDRWRFFKVEKTLP